MDARSLAAQYAGDAVAEWERLRLLQELERERYHYDAVYRDLFGRVMETRASANGRKVER